MKKLYNKAKNDLWVEQNVCMSVIARYGTGGGQRASCFGIQPESRKSGRHGSLPLSSGGYGKWGGYVPMIVDVLPFDTTQITSDKNWSHPKYGDPCHPLASGQHPPTVVIHELSESDRNS